MIVSGVELVNTNWEALRYCPNTWSDAENKRKSAPPMHKANLVTLMNMATKPDAYCAHLKNLPAFEASEVASVMSTADSFSSKDLDFDLATTELWNLEAMAALPIIAAEAMKPKINVKVLGCKKKRRMPVDGLAEQ